MRSVTFFKTACWNALSAPQLHSGQNADPPNPLFLMHLVLPEGNCSAMDRYCNSFRRLATHRAQISNITDGLKPDKTDWENRLNDNSASSMQQISCLPSCSHWMDAMNISGTERVLYALQFLSKHGTLTTMSSLWHQQYVRQLLGRTDQSSNRRTVQSVAFRMLSTCYLNTLRLVQYTTLTWT